MAVAPKNGGRLGPRHMELLAAGAMFAQGGKAVAVLTVDDEGWPHVSLVPAAVAPAPHTLCLPVHAGGRTEQNLRRSGKATAMITDRDLLLYVKGRLRRWLDAGAADPGVKVAELAIETVLEDGEPGAEIVSGIGYRYTEAAAHIAAAERRLLEDLVRIARGIPVRTRPPRQPSR